MPCFHPLKAWRTILPNPKSGKSRIFFRDLHPVGGREVIQLPCGRCIGCRHDYARQWATRCVHEASLYKQNSFITLTYEDKYLNHQNSLDKTDFPKFMKRLRKYFYGNKKSAVRYFHCGEYGENFGRPHHHALLFNFDFPDKKLWKDKKGNPLFRSKILETIWPYGYSVIGSVNFATAAYVARYVIKKINGELAPGHYQGREPEYSTQSRRPGIARSWYEKFKNTDLYPQDYVVLDGTKLKIPKYYNRCYELTNPKEYGTLRDVRIRKAKANENNQPDRLKAAEKIQRVKDQQKKRSYENNV